MEEHTENTPNQPNGQVMDIQAPKTAPGTDSNTDIAVTPEGNLTEAPAELTSAPLAEAPAEVNQPEPASTPTAVSSPSADVPPVVENGSVQPPAVTTPPKKKGPMVAVLVAVIVALGLAGVVVYGYTKSKQTDTASTNKNSTQSVVSKPQASVDDVDTTSKDIDTSLQKASDATDFNTADLSDQSLGL